MTWSEPVKELLALHEAFRTLKYPPEELFIALNPLGQVMFVLDHKGKQFVVNVAFDQDVGAIDREWRLAAEWWNKKATHEEQKEIVTYSLMLRNVPALIEALMRKEVYPIETS